MLTPVFIMAALAVTGVLSTPADVHPQSDTWTEKRSDTPHNDTEVVISLQPYHLTWKAYIHDYGKVYDSVAEESYRFSVFKSNALSIESHNKLYMSGRVQFYLGLNQFSDMELWEYIEYNKLNRKYNDTENRWVQDVAYLEPANLVIPQTVDWRKKGYVTAVKDQGMCGSCWAFSATGSLEGQHFRKTGKLLSLSEQQLVDCSQGFGNQGCVGGWPEWAMSYIRSAGGIQSETTYPYVGRDGVCGSSTAKFVAGCTGSVRVPPSENSLKSAVAGVGPVSVAINAGLKSFQQYKGGVYNDPSCSSSPLNHAVLVVGYGTLGGADYWLVKNSWATHWGNQGYIYMSRNNYNQCGIDSRASYPLV